MTNARNTQSRLAAAHKRLGEPELIRVTGINRATLARVLGGLNVRAGTLLLVDAALDELEKKEKENSGA